MHPCGYYLDDVTSDDVDDIHQNFLLAERVWKTCTLTKSLKYTIKAV
jgi:hypothetical protein